MIMKFDSNKHSVFLLYYHTCPNCKQQTSKVHDYRIQRIYASELRKAHRLKEEFNKVLESKDSCEAREKLKMWLDTAKRSNIAEFKRCIQTFRNWFSEIVASFDVPYTNSITEGFNNKIKVLKRNAYGFMNFERFRKRILLSLAR